MSSPGDLPSCLASLAWAGGRVALPCHSPGARDALGQEAFRWPGTVLDARRKISNRKTHFFAP